MTAVPIKVAIVEDDPQLREAFKTLVTHTADLTCVGAYDSGEQAIAALPGEDPQAVLMDIGLPGMTGIECVRRLKQSRPALQVVMLTSFESP